MPSITRIELPLGIEWDKIEIVFPSEFQFQIVVDGKSYRVLTPAEIGLEDRRTGNPSKAWAYLRLLAQHDGYLPGAQMGKSGQKTDRKAVQQLRRLLKQVFSLDTDPFWPYVQAQGYRTRFTVKMRGSSAGGNDENSFASHFPSSD